jgi:hypothetical protein
MKEMLPQELMYLVVVAKLSTALLKMLGPVKTCILHLRRNTAPNSTALNVGYKYTRGIQATDVLLQRS